MSPFFKKYAGFAAGILIGLIYGAVARLMFGGQLPDYYFGTMSVAFLFLAPVAVGALTIWFDAQVRQVSWLAAIFMPWLACGLAALIAGLFFVEALICLVMALPVLCLMGSLGGVLANAAARWRNRRNQTALLGIILLAPYLAAPIESHFTVRHTQAVVESQIEIKADAATVWQNLIRVAPITEEERPFSLVFDLFGAPKPQAALLEEEGVGRVRRGLFADHLLFLETITVWEPDQRIAWEIQADTRSVTTTPWQEIGGKHFAVTAASYWIEPVGSQRVILHLSSTHRLSTRFNGYGLLWTRWGLDEFQHCILQILKTRSERQAVTLAK